MVMGWKKTAQAWEKSSNDWQEVAKNYEEALNLARQEADSLWAVIQMLLFPDGELKEALKERNNA